MNPPSSTTAEPGRGETVTSGRGAARRINPARPARGPLRSAWQRFRRHPAGLAGLAALALVALTAVSADRLAPYPPHLPNVEVIREPPGPTHPLGTDQLGRDALSRLLHGGRLSLGIGLLATLVSVVIGTALGSVSGYYGGIADGLLMRLTDLALAVPRLLVLLFAGAVLGAGPGLIVLLLGLTGWMHVARLVRSSFLALRAQAFVEAARALGAGDARVITRHILPNAAGPITVAATLGVPSAILTESTLSYLGFGVQPPTATWGNLLQNAQGEMFGAPWLAISPGAAIFLTVMALNFAGDGLRDALDPRAGAHHTRS